MGQAIFILFRVSFSKIFFLSYFKIRFKFRRWEARALKLFEVYVNENRDLRHFLLTCQTYWPGVSSLEIAYLGQCYQFVDNSFVQIELSYLWTIRRCTFPYIWWSNMSNPVGYFVTKLDESDKLQSWRPATKTMAFFSAQMRFWAHVLSTLVFQIIFTMFILSGQLSSKKFTWLELIVLGWGFCILIDYIFDRWSGDFALMERQLLTFTEKCRLFISYRIKPMFTLQKGRFGIMTAFSQEVLLHIFMLICLITAPMLK